MTAPELLALSIGISIVVAGVVLGVMRALDRRLADPVLRERGWALALYLPVLPVLMVGMALVMPVPVEVITSLATQTATVTDPVAVASNGENLSAWFHGHETGLVVLGLAALIAGLRVVGLAGRIDRLRRLLRACAKPAAELTQVVETTAQRIGVSPPDIRVSQTSNEALLAGCFRPVLVLPAALAHEPGGAATPAVCAHELAHLKRGDLHALWIEEVLLVVLAINPFLGSIRDHRAAAREEACDVLALSGAAPSARRAYARALLDVLRSAPDPARTPALTFTSNRRTFVMQRLKSILAPAPSAAPRTLWMIAGIGMAAIAGVGTASLALAAQREPVVLVHRPVVTPAAASAHPTSSSVARKMSVEEPTAPVTRETVLEVAQPKAIMEGSLEVAPEPDVITNPIWAQRPTPVRYPAQALAANVNQGRVAVSCMGHPDGTLSACQIVSEDPVGNGFGAAALEAAGGARLAPVTIDRLAPNVTVRYTIMFQNRG